MTAETTWLTPAAHQKLQDELEQLTTVGRIASEERIAEARSHGDIRENADYDAAKNEQGMMEARIRQIRHILDNAVIKETKTTDTVVVGSLVTIVDSDGDELEYFVATPENKLPGYLLASPSGPLGSALLGTKVGDEVDYEAPGGQFIATVKGIRPFDG